MSKQKRTLSLIVTALSVVVLLVLGSGVKKSAPPSLFTSQPANAQIVNSQDAWRQVYQQLPNLPLENQYVNKETGKADRDSTLANRLIRYHVSVKGRPPNYRLDWKLTLADYLGVNEVMQESRYPGYDTLRQNPMEGDRAAISRLNRAQRDALVQVLVGIFNAANNPATPAAAPNASPQSFPAPSPVARPTTSLPSLPQARPGDAQLLRP